MNLTCNHCKTKLNIPDHKIPQDKDTSFKCPKCKEKIHIPAMNSAAKSTGEEIKVKKQPVAHQGLAFEDRLNALVCIGAAGLKQTISSTVDQMEFNADVVDDVKSALARMEYHIYHLVIVDDAFDSGNGFAGIMERMNSVDMSMRRKICLVKVSDKFNTNDDMAAMHSSVNSMIHTDDIVHLEPFLSRAMMEHKQLYTVYNESLKQTGKA